MLSELKLLGMWMVRGVILTLVLIGVALAFVAWLDDHGLLH
jgi:hypothetical protein